MLRKILIPLVIVCGTLVAVAARESA